MIECGGAMLLLSWQRRWSRPRLLLDSHQKRHFGEEAVQVDRRALKGQARLHRLAYALNQARVLDMCWAVQEVVQEVEVEVSIPARLHSVDSQTSAVGLQQEQYCQHSQARAAC